MQPSNVSICREEAATVLERRLAGCRLLRPLTQWASHGRSLPSLQSPSGWPEQRWGGRVLNDEL